MIKVDIKLTDNFTKQLQGLSNGISKHVIRSAARAGALAYYNILQANTPVGPTGNLKNSIYHAFATQKDTPNYKEYQVGFRGAHGGSNKKDDGGGLAKANHLHLVEYGYIQTYQVGRNKKGELVTFVRPESFGKKLPPGATKAQKDAYFLPRKRGPIQVPGKGFVRRSIQEAQAVIPAAVAKRATERLNEIIKNPTLVSAYVD